MSLVLPLNDATLQHQAQHIAEETKDETEQRKRLATSKQDMEKQQK